MINPEFVGFKRDPDKSSTFPNASGRPHRPSPALPAPRAGPSTNVATVRNKPSGRAQSTASTGPPAKRQKRTHKPSTTNPFLKRDHAAMQAGSVGSTSRHEVICISDSDEEPAPKKPAHSKASTSIPKGETAGRVEEEEEVDYALMHAALDLDCQRNVSTHGYQPKWLANSPFISGKTPLRNCGRRTSQTAKRKI
ncbi:hypothetical protein C8Q78DRAFT_160354 [Trametes maxima]|nr:hypothetical protein C8Q78DRAFT_160354 [Trametes maxima]